MSFQPPLDRDLDRIRTLFLQMCVRGESMVRQAVRAVVERDSQLARAVVQRDKEMNRLEMEIDDLCLRVLALRQPVGTDLRLVTTVMKMVTDVERIGDLAVNIAERGLELAAGSGAEADLALNEMGRLAADMVRTAAEAFVERDVALARGLKDRDTEIDALNRANFHRWLSVMAAQPDQADRALAITSVSKHLERVADHAVNLGEMVVFFVEGHDVRHASSD